MRAKRWRWSGAKARLRAQRPIRAAAAMNWVIDAWPRARRRLPRLMAKASSTPSASPPAFRIWRATRNPKKSSRGEALLEELNGVDFHKGCFVGQENVSRMKRRATTRKKFCRIVFAGAAPAYGTAIKAGEAEIGAVRTGVGGARHRARASRSCNRGFRKWRPLSADGREIRLDPPDWLILPSREEG